MDKKQIDHDNLGKKNLFLKQVKQCSSILSQLNTKRQNYVKNDKKKLGLSQPKIAYKPLTRVIIKSIKVNLSNPQLDHEIRIT